MKYIFLLLMFTTLGCSTVRFNKSLVRHWSSQEQEKEPFRVPYVSTSKKGNTKLIYIAADHENSITSRTFKTIKKVISESSPKFVVLEGFPYKGETSPEWYLNHSKRCEKSKFQKCGEPSYAAMLANKNSIPFAGGEPTDVEIFEELLNSGYGELDAVGFYLLRQIPQLRRQKKLKPNDFKRQSEKYMSIFVKRFGFKNHFSFEDFKTWYLSKSKMKKNF